MSFGQPLFLLGLIAVPLLWLFLTAANASRRQALKRLGDAGLIDKLAESLNDRGRRWQQRFWLLGLGLVIFALALPQWGTSTQVVQQDGIQIMVALDISTSMLSQDVQPDRLTRAKQTVSELMDQLDGDQIGLVLFSGASFIQFPLTNDYGTARSFLFNATPGMISRPGTAIADAIRTARQGFDLTRSSQKVILIMTDGETHEGNAVANALSAADNGITIYAIGFGSPDGAPVPEFDLLGRVVGFKQDESGQVLLSRLDEDALKQISEAGNGAYFRASASGEEIAALAGIINQLESAELDSRFEVQAVQRFQLFLFAGILCFIVAELLPERRRRPRRTFEQLVGALLIGILLVGCVQDEGAILVSQGNEAYAGQQYEDAQTLYTDARAAGEDSAVPVYNIANTQFRLNAYEESEQTMQQALAFANADLSAAGWYNLGTLYLVQDQCEQAISALQEALRLNPEDADAKYNLELANACLAQQQAEQEAQEQEDEQTPEEEAEEEESADSEEQDEESEDAGADEEEQPEEPTPTPASEEPADSEENSEEQPPEQPTEEAPQPESEQSEEPPDPDAPPTQGQSGEMTEDQATQLLDAIGQSTATLQERLQQIYVVPGPAPVKDY